MSPDRGSRASLTVIGPEAPGETGYRRRARFHQAWYRGTVLGLRQYGELETGSRRPLGSVLSRTDGFAGRNFISEDVRQLYKQRRAQGWGLEPQRCQRYMTSSQALTLNIFGTLNRDPEWLTRTVSNLLKRTDVRTVRSLHVEFAPNRPSQYLGDKTRVDALCWLETETGVESLVFEIKFLDRFNSRWVDLRRNERYLRLFHETGIWRSEEPSLLSRTVNQLVRCHALAVALQGSQASDIHAPILVVVHHPEDPATTKIAQEYRAVLARPELLRMVTLTTLFSVMAEEAHSKSQNRMCDLLTLRYADQAASDRSWRDCSFLKGRVIHAVL